MVESLKELNKICQKPRYRESGNFMARYMVRDVALPITWLLLHTSITANQVTLVSLFIAILSMVFFVIPTHVAFLSSVLLLQFWYILDHVDGQIARYRKTTSLSGRFFDFLMHHIIHGSIFFAMSFYCFEQSGLTIFFLWGFVVSLGILLFNLIHDTKYKTFFEQLLRVKGSIQFSLSGNSEGSHSEVKTNWSRKCFSFFHKISEIHVLMNILTVAALLQFFLTGTDFRYLLFLIYGLIVPMISLAKIVYVITQKKIDEEFYNQFSFQNQSNDL